MKDLYSDRVPSNSLDGLSLEVQSFWVVGALGAAGAGAAAPSRWRIPLVSPFW